MERQQSIGLDVHKDYSVFRILESPGGMGPVIRISHSNGELQRFLMTLPPGSPVAVEACGSWMWITGELEKAGLVPHLAHPLKVKKMTPGSTRTDATDAAALATLLASGTLPEVWMATPAVRDLRGLVRTRLARLIGLAWCVLRRGSDFGLRCGVPLTVPGARRSGFVAARRGPDVTRCGSIAALTVSLRPVATA